MPMPLDAIRTISGAVPDDAIVFVDEAYAEFAGATFIPDLPSFPNVVVGRTFSKAFGLAGLRVGCLVGAPDRLDPVRLTIPVYSVNIAAIVAVQAALDDLPYVQEYVRQVAESKTLLYAACDRLGLKYWKSAANFVLVQAGDRAAALVKGVEQRGIYLRDRSNEPGCAGCVRIATGAVAHTKQCIEAMDEVLCVAG
jgi:histidinol-phosphate aminotransferase